MPVYDISTVKRTIATYFRLNSFRKASNESGIPKSTLHGWVSRFGRGIDGRKRIVRQKRHRHRKRNLIRDSVKNELDVNPFHTLSTLKRTIGTSLSLASLSRVVTDIDYSRQKVYWRVPPRDVSQELAAFHEDMHTLLHDNTHILSIDETGFVSNDMPSKGYGKRGQRIRRVKLQPHRYRVSSVMAISTDGKFYSSITDGAINGAAFQNFIRTIDRQPRGSVAVMDNISFHKSNKVKNLARARGIKLLFTPPYSPECNPVENFFALVKHDVRQELLECNTPTMDSFMHVVERSTYRAAERYRPFFRSFFSGNRERGAFIRRQ